MRSKIDISADHSLSGLQISTADISSGYTSVLESLLSELRELNPIDIQASIQNFGHGLPSHALLTAWSRMDVTAGAAWQNLPALIAADAIPHVEGCDCGACSFKEEELTRIDNGTGDGGVSGTGNAAILGDMADYLLTGYWDTGFGDGTRSHNVTSSGIDANDGVLHFNLSGYSADSDGVTSDRAFLIREAFKLFEATLGIQFVETTSTDTNVVDFFFRDNDSGAYAGHSYYDSGAWGSSIHYAQINVAQSWSGGTSTYDDYTLQTILHEIGHALGLGHQGPYNGSATYGTDNQFDNDSWQASMMSYFSQTENSSIDASYELLQTPMAVDWIALDEIYGRQGYGTSNAFVEDTVWGFNTTVTSEVSDIWANWYLYADRTASTIVDGGGIDTLDLSGYSNNTLINLAPSDAGSTSPSISDVGGRIGNLTIAQGTIIENAIGGAGSETFYGNSANNSFIGNGGDDTFYDSLGSDTYNGGAGIDYVVFGNSFGSYLIEIVGGVLQVIDTAIDWVEDTVEWLTFAGETFSWQAVANSIGPNTAPVANDDSYSVNEDDILSVNDFLSNDTDADGNTLNVASVNGVVIESGVDGTQINLASGAILTVYKNGSFDYDSNGVFDDLNVGEQAFDSFNYIASDGRDQSNPATVTITVDGAFDNTPPQAVSDSYTVDEDVVLAGIDVLANDSDIDVGQDLSIVAIEGVNISAGQTLLLLSGALVTLNSDGTLDYDQNGAFDALSAGQGGIDYFIYSVSDGTSSSDAIVSISINGVTDNLNPTATDDTGSVAENATTTGNVLTNDSDQDGGTLSVTAVNGALENVGSQIVLASGALLTLSASGDYLYDPNGAFDALEDGQSASDAFTYTISDGQGGSATASVSVTISGVSPPTVSEAIAIDFEGMATGPYTGQDDLVFADLTPLERPY